MPRHYRNKHGGDHGHICAMNNGQVTVFGTPRDVMNDETLSHLFHTPVSVFDHSGRLLASYF